MNTTWEDALDTMTISELYEEAAEQLREGYPIPVDVYYKLADAGYVLA